MRNTSKSPLFTSGLWYIVYRLSHAKWNESLHCCRSMRIRVLNGAIVTQAICTSTNPAHSIIRTTAHLHLPSPLEAQNWIASLSLYNPVMLQFEIAQHTRIGARGCARVENVGIVRRAGYAPGRQPYFRSRL
jgi:hypothetical protein